MVVSKKLIEVGKIIQFRINEIRDVVCRGTCIWSKGNVNPDFYIAGFKLDKMKEKEKEFICELISKAKY